MLKKSVIEAILKNRVCRQKLMGEMLISYPTLKRYLTDNHILLTTDKALNIISETCGLKRNDLLQKQKA